jgi:hypothetical protein
LIDEDFPRDVAQALAGDARATSVVIAVDEGWQGDSDAKQVNRAFDIGGVLISHNHREHQQFGAFVERERASRGSDWLFNPAKTSVLFLWHDASKGRLLMRTAMLLDWYLMLALPKPPTLRWHEAQEALRGGWRPAGYSGNDVRVALGQLPPSP